MASFQDKSDKFSNPAAVDLLQKILPRSPDSGDLRGVFEDPRFKELLEIVNLAMQVHGAKTQAWFNLPEPELGFVHPATLMRDPANGRKLVRQSLLNHLRGFYALGGDGKILPRSQPVITPAPRAIRRARKTAIPKSRRKPY